MITKIVAIKNVGRFRNCSASGDVQFRRATLIFAPNGRGKTTLCDIVRSLKTGDPAPILGRGTLGASDTPHAKVLIDAAPFTFANGTWTDVYPNVEIFDSRFVVDNVYTGDSVTHDQRRNLFNVIIGAEGLGLRERVDDLDAKSREAAKQVAEKESALQRAIPHNRTVAAFLALEPDPDIDAKIVEAERDFAAFSSATELQAKETLTALALPEFPEGIPELLERTLADVSHTAEEHIRSHTREHMRQSDEPWLTRGLELIKSAECPFCASPISDSQLIADFRAFFAKSYAALKAEVQAMLKRLDTYVTAGTVPRLEQRLESNFKIQAEWRAFVATNDVPTLDASQIGHRLSELAELTRAALRRKRDAPLEPISLQSDFESARRHVREAHESVDAYNRLLEQVNVELRRKKADTRTGHLTAALHILELCRAIKARHEPPLRNECEAVNVARLSKKYVDAEKSLAKLQLEQYSLDVFQRYQSRINALLLMFGASFSIERAEGEYLGGKPRATYCIRINDTAVDLGDSFTPLDKPSFKNTLSAGDRSALALAFFIAQIEQDPNKADITVLLDDPFTSQDTGRRTCTQQMILKLVRDTKQVVLLSHDQRFLRFVWDDLPNSERKALQLVDFGSETIVKEWDIADAVQDEYVQNFKHLWMYCHLRNGDPSLVVKLIRPLLEGYLRWKLPNDIDEHGWLGDYVADIEAAVQGSPLYAARGILPELRDIKDYAKQYHHPQTVAGSGGPVDSDELLAYGKRTLALVQAF